MRKVLFILAVLFLLRSPGLDLGSAQTKKSAEGAGAIEISEGKDGKFRFFVRDGEGKLVAMSSPGGFATVKEAEAAVARLKAIVATAKVTTAKKAATRGKGKESK